MLLPLAQNLGMLEDIGSEPPMITTTNLAHAYIGRPYSRTLVGLGGGTWSVSAGALPTGFSLAGATGIISNANPTVIEDATFTIRLDNGTPPAATREFTLRVKAVPPGRRLSSHYVSGENIEDVPDGVGDAEIGGE